MQGLKSLEQLLPQVVADLGNRTFFFFFFYMVLPLGEGPSVYVKKTHEARIGIKM